MYQEQFVERLIKLRVEKGVSARDMSLSIGQNAGYINAIECGKSLPSMSAFFYICDYLGITPTDFFSTDIPYPEQYNELMSYLNTLDKNDFLLVMDLVKSLSNKN